MTWHQNRRQRQWPAYLAYATVAAYYAPQMCPHIKPADEKKKRSSEEEESKIQTTSINAFAVITKQGKKMAERVWRVLGTRIILMNQKFDVSVFHPLARAEPCCKRKRVECRERSEILSSFFFLLSPTLPIIASRRKAIKSYTHFKDTLTQRVCCVPCIRYISVWTTLNIVLLAATSAQHIFKICTYLTGRRANVSRRTTRKYAFGFGVCARAPQAHAAQT